MKFVLSIILLSLAVACTVSSCQKYKDQPATDPGLTNPYCNDPAAVNYNWGFPGKPDNTVCFYPVDLFRGNYNYIDSISQPDGTFAYSVTRTLSFYALTSSKLAVVGFCGPGDSLKLTAGPTYIASVDSNTATGQLLCNVQDTVTGSITKDRYDTSNALKIYFTVVTDTGYTIHSGTATKQ